MEPTEIFVLVNRWMSANYKALKHGAYLADQLYAVQKNCSDKDTVAYANRLYHRVYACMHKVRVKATRVYGQPTVAFLPVARIDDETGAVSYPTDDIQYPVGCTREQRIQLQFERACREFEGEPKAETKKPRRRKAAAKKEVNNEQS